MKQILFGILLTVIGVGFSTSAHDAAIETIFLILALTSFLFGI